jgi:hypothetical protein
VNRVDPEEPVTPRYEYRDRAPVPWLVGALLVGGCFLTVAFTLMEGGFETRFAAAGFGIAGAMVAFAGLLASRYRLTVTPEAISYLPTKVTIDTDDIHRVFLARGRREIARLRDDLTFTRRVAVPPWHREAAWMLVRRPDGLLDAYLLAIGDPDAFIAALGRGWDDVAAAWEEDLPEQR